VTLFVGIDEAGYGPLLGPLVVTACAFRCDEPETEAIEKRLSAALEAAGGIEVGDSKTLYSRKRGPARLEKAALAFTAAAGGASGSLRALLASCAGGRELLLERYPWYGSRRLALPAFCDADALEAAREALCSALKAAGVEFPGAHVRVILPGELNGALRTGMNKGALVAGEVGELLARVSASADDGRVFAAVDKLGGRHYYGELLQAFFPFEAVTVLEETPRRSVYQVRPGGRLVHVTFAERSDATCLATGLASVFSKYVRELFMRLFNEYWQGLLPGLDATAGYWTDAKRFLAQLAESLHHRHVPLDLLVRQR